MRVTVDDGGRQKSPHHNPRSLLNGLNQRGVQGAWLTPFTMAGKLTDRL
jgi:hypothetical protein